MHSHKAAAEYRELAERDIHSAPGLSHVDTVYFCGGGMKTLAINAYGQMSICAISQQDTYDTRQGSLSRRLGEVSALGAHAKAHPADEMHAMQDSVALRNVSGEWRIGDGDKETPVPFLCEVAHLRALSLGLEVPAHGDCEFCATGAEHDRVRSAAGAHPLAETNVEDWMEPVSLFPVLNQGAARTACGGCGWRDTEGRENRMNEADRTSGMREALRAAQGDGHQSPSRRGGVGELQDRQLGGPGRRQLLHLALQHDRILSMSSCRHFRIVAGATGPCFAGRCRSRFAVAGITVEVLGRRSAIGGFGATVAALRFSRQPTRTLKCGSSGVRRIESPPRPGAFSLRLRVERPANLGTGFVSTSRPSIWAAVLTSACWPMRTFGRRESSSTAST